MRSEVESVGSVSESDDRGESTPRCGVDGSLARRERARVDPARRREELVGKYLPLVRYHETELGRVHIGDSG
jgi:hypothetical protein